MELSFTMTPEGPLEQLQLALCGREMTQWMQMKERKVSVNLGVFVTTRKTKTFNDTLIHLHPKAITLRGSFHFGIELCEAVWVSFQYETPKPKGFRAYLFYIRRPPNLSIRLPWKQVRIWQHIASRVGERNQNESQCPGWVNEEIKRFFGRGRYRFSHHLGKYPPNPKKTETETMRVVKCPSLAFL